MATAHARVREGTTELLTSRRAIRAGEMIVGAFVFLLLLQWLLGFDLFDPEMWRRYSRSFSTGILETLRYIAFIIPISVGIGFVVGWARVSKYRVISWPLAVYVDFFRGVPPLVLVIFAFLFGPTLFPPRFGGKDLAINIAAIAIAMHSGAYQAEIFRAGFQSVSRGQLEAAQALGLRPGKAMRYIVLPQALRLSLPPLGNEFAVVIKDTSLLAVVGSLELFGVSSVFTQQIPILGGDLVWLFAIWTSVAFVYFCMTFTVTRVLLLFERKYRVRGLEAMSI